MAVNDYYYAGPGYSVPNVATDYGNGVTIVQNLYGTRFLGKDNTPYMTFESAQRSYNDPAVNMNFNTGSWTANEIVIGVSGDMKQNGTQVFAVSEAEIVSALGLEEGEKITNITWEKGTNHFPGGIVISTEKAKAETDLGTGIKAGK